IEPRPECESRDRISQKIRRTLSLCAMPQNLTRAEDVSSRAQRENRRFRAYCDAIDRVGITKMGWRSQTDARALLQKGRQALKTIRRLPLSPDETTRPEIVEAVQRLEEAVNGLTRGDDWTRRLAPFLETRTPRARTAFDRLVRLGCVPDALTLCLEQ